MKPEARGARAKALRLLRDVAIIWAATGISGLWVRCVASMTGGQVTLGAVGRANLLFMSLGFCLVGHLVASKKFVHLLIVALLTWLTSLVNVALGIITPYQWLHALVGVIVFMLLGWSLSIALTRLSRGEPPKAHAEEAL